jgi:hypothetical protein
VFFDLFFALFDLKSGEFSFYNATMDIYGDLNVYEDVNILNHAKTNKALTHCSERAKANVVFFKSIVI